ncbi:WxL domain-containing protein [Lacticaseibacillus chiayiensis]|uniref:WxL domain-containing protein n=1 Tax=Lacticaseibacillus chiayiensis TaxID=2100821 RepID=UPI00101264D1|nr:WxL domain-containing protein [Lacticaseibacillus chiayiensis]RXT59345.1 cell surface protein [Lacticaseibacillus chiayiensis]
MRRNNHLKLLTLAALTLGMATKTSSTIVSADDARSVTTDGSVKILQSDAPTSVLNPLNPKEKSSNVVGGQDNTKNAGGDALTLDYVSKFDFGQLKLDPDAAITVYAKADLWTDQNGQKVAVPNRLQVTDKRLGADAWKVSLSASDLQSEEKDSQGKVVNTVKIKDAFITLLESRVIDSRAQDVSARFGLKKAVNIYMGDGQATDILAVNDKEVAKGTFINLFNSAKAGEGVSLTVPAESYKTKGLKSGAFTSKLTWTLTSAPI